MSGTMRCHRNTNHTENEDFTPSKFMKFKAHQMISFYSLFFYSFFVLFFYHGDLPELESWCNDLWRFTSLRTLQVMFSGWTDYDGMFKEAMLLFFAGVFWKWSLFMNAFNEKKVFKCLMKEDLKQQCVSFVYFHRFLLLSVLINSNSEILRNKVTKSEMKGQNKLLHVFKNSCPWKKSKFEQLPIIDLGPLRHYNEIKYCLKCVTSSVY